MPAFGVVEDDEDAVGLSEEVIGYIADFIRGEFFTTPEDERPAID